ncbi:hypothetical protein [Streptomyces chiangmaiensis]|uniref:Uncharacterized protein n=1 Tax=Streptomyces chiangmaiensis TaxID=766497 RepID=A0ABU7FVZ1_9ACTN|nr:hypothetical protein [Streptomyces chiangmaiensis]MED7827259.1 hypothetical protein [Streptomyces chiangmaiensis]
MHWRTQLHEQTPSAADSAQFHCHYVRPRLRVNPLTARTSPAP